MPTLPPGSEVVVSVKAPLIVMLRLAVAVAAAESVTFTVKAEVPMVVGVPVMAPLVAPVGVSAKPGGNAPAMMLHV